MQRPGLNIPQTSMAGGGALAVTRARTQTDPQVMPVAAAAASTSSDSHSKGCFRCHRDFTFTRRKHRCRNCSSTICNSCSSKRIVLPNSAQQAVRVCDPCYGVLLTQFQRDHLKNIRRPSITLPDLQQQQLLQLQQSAMRGSVSGGNSGVFGNAGSLSNSLTSLPESQPWNDDLSCSTTAQSGWNIEAGGRWFSSFFFADPSASTVATVNTAPVENSANQTSEQTTNNSMPNLTALINPNHIESVALANEQAQEAQKQQQQQQQQQENLPHQGLPRSHSNSLSLARFHPHSLHPSTPLLTPEQQRTFTLLLFNSYLCVNLMEEKIKLQVPDVLWHSLPRKHIESLSSEGEVEEQITRKAKRYNENICRNVRANREAWMEFMNEFNYDDEANVAQPPPILTYPSPPPPFCLGTLIITNYQVIFIPDFTIILYWNSILCVEERRRWNLKKSLHAADRVRRASVASNPSPCPPVRTQTIQQPQPQHQSSPKLDIYSSSPSETPSPSPDAVADPNDSASPPTTPLTPSHESAMIAALAEEQELNNQTQQQKVASPQLNSAPIIHAHHIPRSNSLSNSATTTATATTVTSVASSNISGHTSTSSVSSSSIFHSYRNASHLHLPHYRLYQQFIQGSGASPADFDPLLFAPPFITVPLLALRKLKSLTFDSKDVGMLELKTKLHHGVLRFCLLQLNKAQKMTQFKNLKGSLEWFMSFAPLAPGGVVMNSGRRPDGSNVTNLRSPQGSQDSPAPQSEIQQKVFAFKHTWVSVQQQFNASVTQTTTIVSTSTVSTPTSPSSVPNGDPGWFVYDPMKEFRRLNLIPHQPAPNLPSQSPSPANLSQSNKQTGYPFRLTDINRNYTFCSSYPRFLIVPSALSDSDLLPVANYRSKKRIPTIVWAGPIPSPPIPPLKSVEKDAAESVRAAIKTRRALLLRSAQPLTGLTGQRCAEDEALLHQACAAVGSDRFLIIDCRPSANAYGQAALGAGYENAAVWYVNPLPARAGNAVPSTFIKEANIQFLNIDNIHAARKSHAQVEKLSAKLVEEEAEVALTGWRVESGVRVQNHDGNTIDVNSRARSTSPPAIALDATAPYQPVTNVASSHMHVIPAPTVPFPTPNPSAATFIASLHATGHFVHLSNILAGVNQVIHCLSQGITVLIHCSDGWDRTALLTSLSQLCLDSYYRTLEGFIVLIEKEWLSFGHRFCDRLGHGSFTNEVSPILLQFLDCVYQYIQQFPSQFQFDQRILLFIYYHAHAGLYATFFFNSEEERVRNQAYTFRSVWSYVIEHIQEFVNPLYGNGWADLSKPIMNPTVQSAHAAFRSIPQYVDNSALYLDCKSLSFWQEMYLAGRNSLEFTYNTIPTSSSPLSNNGNPKFDCNPVQFYFELNQKQEVIEHHQAQIDRLEIEKCMGQMLTQLQDEETDRLRAQVEVVAPLVSSIVDNAFQTVTKQWIHEEMQRQIAFAVQRAKENHVISATEIGEGDLANNKGNSSQHKPSLRYVDSNYVQHHSNAEKLSASLAASQLPSKSESPANIMQPRNLFGAGVQTNLDSPARPISPSLLSNMPVRLLDKSQWTSDSSVSRCQACQTQFTVFTRRCHCRRCGCVMCNSCAPHQTILVVRTTPYKTGRGYDELLEPERRSERICGSCALDIKRASDSQKAPIDTTPNNESIAASSSQDRGSVPLPRVNRAHSMFVGPQMSGGAIPHRGSVIVHQPSSTNSNTTSSLIQNALYYPNLLLSSVRDVATSAVTATGHNNVTSKFPNAAVSSTSNGNNKLNGNNSSQKKQIDTKA